MKRGSNQVSERYLNENVSPSGAPAVIQLGWNWQLAAKNCKKINPFSNKSPPTFSHLAKNIIPVPLLTVLKLLNDINRFVCAS